MTFARQDDTLEWREQAACRGHDSDLWFPPKGGEGGGKAKKVCDRCPVQAECLDYALDTNQIFGIWGGLNQKERLVARRRRREGVA